MQVPVANVPTYSRTCVLSRVSRITFRHVPQEIESGATGILSPILKMDKGYESAERPSSKWPRRSAQRSEGEAGVSLRMRETKGLRGELRTRKEIPQAS